MASEGLNKVLLIGNLGLDPELKYTQGGQAVLRLRLATTERYGNKAGERQERTEWHTVIVWGNRAEALNKILHKGRTIYVEGRLQTRNWEDKDGGKRSTTEIVATQILLLGGGQRGEGGEGGYGGGGGGYSGGGGGGGGYGGGGGGGYGGGGRGGGGYGGGGGGRGGGGGGGGGGGHDAPPDDLPPDDFGGDDIPF
ncbi:single-stranded DNA-binding protein [Sandaracinus amylolyticus]|uniref:single-stranded DNA-binding protein n=1 Tax=Sandaracinus amylolyticus TaxID=927083 RepID=UPI00069E4AE4|nr:single-stranded DNA-binding protein [Sandaracinus amylolyticus]